MAAASIDAVVVGVDGAPGGAGALRYAVADARRRSAPLRLVHVLADGVTVVPPLVTPSSFRCAGRAVLDRATATARARPGARDREPARRRAPEPGFGGRVT